MKSHTALVIVDVQAGFINEHTEQIPSLIHEIATTVAFDQIICTRFVNAPASPYRRILGWHRFSTSDDTMLDEKIADLDAITIDKHTYTPNIHRITGLVNSGEIDRIYVAGIDTDACVLMTAISLFEAGHETFVLADLSMSHVGLAYHDAALRILPRLIGKSNVIHDSKAHFQATKSVGAPTSAETCSSGPAGDRGS